MRLCLLRLLPLLLLVAVPRPVQAGQVEDAEVQRLSVELRDRVADARWEAADTDYRRLVAVAGGQPAYADHWRGYLAAQALGDANAEHGRLLAARALDDSDEVSVALAQLLAWYGSVDIRLGGHLDPRPPLTMLDVPFEADQRRVLEAATIAIAEQGRYQGLLPLGMYTLGSARFEVLGEERPVRVRVAR